MKTLSISKIGVLIGLFMLAGLIFSGCPYESAYALSGEKVTVDRRLFGSFHSEDGILQIEKENSFSFHYRYEDSVEPKSIDTGSGYIVRHESSLYAVVTFSDNLYLIYKIINVQQNSFTITELSDERMPYDKSFASVEEFSTFVFSSNDMFNPAPTVFTRM